MCETIHLTGISTFIIIFIITHQDEVARCRAVLRVLRSVEHGHTLAVLRRAALARDPM